MGFLGKLFGGGGGPRRPPSWAKGWSDGARFDAWTEAVAAHAEARGYPIDPRDVRTGSVMIALEPGGRREWIVYSLAEQCVDAEPDAWPAMIERAFRGDTGLGGDGDDDRDDAPAGADDHDDDADDADDDAAADVPAGKAWVMGTAPWGGVMLECGEQEMVAILLPVVDPAALAAIPAMPPGLVRAIVVCNHGADGALAASAVAAAAGVARVYALDPARPIDRGVDPTSVAPVPPVPVDPLPARLRAGTLALEPQDTSVFAIWDNDICALIGPAVPLSLIGELEPQHVIGGVTYDEFDPDELAVAIAGLARVIVMANVPGVDADRQARAFQTMGVAAEIAHAPPASRRLRVVTHVISGELDAADALAREAIALGEDVADMHFQRATIALMRGDEDTALAELVQAPELPPAMHSRALLLARRGDPDAKGLAAAALARLPGDAIAIHGAVLTHAVLGDRDGARGVLDSHGHHLEAEARAVLARSIDAPPRAGIHRFPEHARVAAAAARPLVDAGRYDHALPLLRRAADWDPGHLEHTAELGFVLGKLSRDDDAITLYDDAIARGGSAVLLRFNRGNARLRTQRFADAVADFRACVALKPDWHEARINLVSALFADGHAADAGAELAALRDAGGPDEHVRALEQMLSGDR